MKSLGKLNDEELPLAAQSEGEDESEKS